MTTTTLRGAGLVVEGITRCSDLEDFFGFCYMAWVLLQFSISQFSSQYYFIMYFI